MMPKVPDQEAMVEKKVDVAPKIDYILEPEAKQQKSFAEEQGEPTVSMPMMPVAGAPEPTA